jgi:hypothetical protein
LLSSTLLDIAVTPAVFSLFGKRASGEYFQAKQTRTTHSRFHDLKQ